MEVFSIVVEERIPCGIPIEHYGGIIGGFFLECFGRASGGTVEFLVKSPKQYWWSL